MQEAHSALAAWESFYVIVGSSGAALTGLQFVVITLIAESPRKSTGRELAAFGTPTVVHFCSVLLMAAILSAPWRELSSVAWALGIFGIAGVLYCLITLTRARRQTGYQPVLEDWVWHIILPFLAYGSALTAAIFLRRTTHSALFAVAGCALLLLFIGIHNAWDAVTYFVTLGVRKHKK